MKSSVTAKASDSPFDIGLNHKQLYYRRTKIVATVGPASNSPRMLRKLISGGVNVIRINFSHGDPKDHVKVMRLIRRISAQLETSVAILADLCGPKVRVGKFKGDAVTLKEGSTVWITTDAVLGTETLIPSQYRGIAREARVGDTVLLDDGNLELKVLKKVGGRLQAKVIHGGLLKNNKGMNLPYTPMNISALTDKDRRDVTFAVRGGADYVALSFVRNAQDILDLRRCLKALKVETPTITPDRAEQVDFSIPYLVTREAILVPKGSSIKSFDDLKGKRIAVTAGSISLRRMRASIPSLPDATLVVTPLSFGNLEAVAKGEADAASNDLINLMMMQRASDHPDRYDIIDIGDRFDQKPFGVGVKKGRQSLVDRLNQAIKNLSANGEIDRLLNENIAGVSASIEGP